MGVRQRAAMCTSRTYGVRGVQQHSVWHHQRRRHVLRAFVLVEIVCVVWKGKKEFWKKKGFSGARGAEGLIYHSHTRDPVQNLGSATACMPPGRPQGALFGPAPSQRRAIDVKVEARIVQCDIEPDGGLRDGRVRLQQEVGAAEEQRVHESVPPELGGRRWRVVLQVMAIARMDGCVEESCRRRCIGSVPSRRIRVDYLAARVVCAK